MKKLNIEKSTQTKHNVAMDKNNITLLCKVVDNYGDIGFVYRLARSISKKNPDAKLRLVVSNLNSFSKMAPGVDENLSVQEFNGWKVLDWNADEVCKNEFAKNPPSVILECFQCGRPEWLEEILFDKERTEAVQIVNVEYLTAEDWAEEFHLLKSGTRSAMVRKMNFMPGFTEKTGGLLFDEKFTSFVKDKNLALEELKSVPQIHDALSAFTDSNVFAMTYFSYGREFKTLVSAFERFQNSRQQENENFQLQVFLAAGLSQKPFVEEFKRQNASFKIVELPYLQQSQWDALITLSDFNFIRGEDSFCRAALSGKPFMWHAYFQDGEFQIVKVEAFVKRMKPFFEQTLFEKLQKYFCLFNRDNQKTLEEEARSVLLECCGCQNNSPEQMEELLFELLNSNDELSNSFASYSESLYKNGDLADHLLEYISGC